MPLFQIKGDSLIELKPEKIHVEKQIQSFVEGHLKEIFGLDFVNTEFAIDNFRFDTLAWDPDRHAIAIIEYKKARHESVVDQGVAYALKALQNKPALILALLDKFGDKIERNSINWDELRIIFVSTAYNAYQKNITGFGGLRMELWQVTPYEGGLYDFDRLQEEQEEREPITQLLKTEEARAVASEVKEYSLKDHIPSNWVETEQLYKDFKERLLNEFPESTERFQKFYIAFDKPNGKSFVEMHPQKQGIKVWLRPDKSKLAPRTILLRDMTAIGHHGNGNTELIMASPTQVTEVIDLIKQSRELE